MGHLRKERRSGDRRSADRTPAAGADPVAALPLADGRFDQLVDFAPDAILIHDGEQILLANHAAVRLAGASTSAELVGHGIDRFLDPPYLKAIQAQLLDGRLPRNSVLPVRDAFRRLDGREVPVEVTAIGFIERGEAVVHLVIRDITDRITLQNEAHRAEEQLHQAQKMDAVGALAGGVAHEVNNMMTIILGFSDFLLKDGAVLPERAEDVRHIAAAAERAASITQQMLAFSRRGFFHPQHLDLAALLRKLEPLIRRLLGEGRSLEMEPGGTRSVWADPSQLEQVIVNLALNARDAMPGGGRLMVSVSERIVTDSVESAGGPILPGAYAVVTIRDTGIGMDAKTQSRAFEPFFTTKEVGQGSGLGLAAVFGIMKQNEGYITLATMPGRGATFELYLPLLERRAEAEPDAPPRADDATPTPRSGTILVIEDEAAVRTIAIRALERAGFEVLGAGDGVEALRLLAGPAPDPDLVLTDLVMPEMGGAELIERLRDRWPALPVVYMSGYTEEQLKREGAPGFDGHLVRKPFTPSRLVEIVVEALEGVGR